MAAPKGHERYGGRTKGIPNLITSEAKEMLKIVLEPHLTPEKFNEHLENVHKSQRLSVIAKLLVYIIPKNSHVENDMFSNLSPSEVSEILIQISKDYERSK